MSNEMNDARLRKILIVDDTSANLQLLMNLLAEHGYAVYPASDGELALEFLRSTIPDLILLDVRMPGMDGYEVCRRLKADEKTRAIPVIFISILEDEHEKVRGFQAGAVDYVTKPFQAEEVLARVGLHLRLRELTEHLEQTVAERTAELLAVNAQLQTELDERKRAEEALRESERKARAILDQGSQFVGMMTVDGILIDTNRTALEFAGVPASAVLNKPFWDSPWWAHSPELRERLRAAVKTAAAGETVRFEATHPAADGSLHFIDFSLQPVMDEAGNVLFLIPEGYDITESKQAEMALLREKQFTEKLLESLPGIFFLYDPTCHLKRWNKAHETVMGFTSDELRDWYIPDWHETPEDAAKGMALVKSVLETGVGGAFETTLINKQGRFVPYLISITRLMTPEGPFMMGVGIDITERKQAEAEKERLQAQLVQAQKVESVGRLAGGVAHDFNNMLCVILGQVEMILARLPAGDPMRTELAEIQKAAEHSADLTRQLLAFARKQTVAPRIIDLNVTVEGMLKMLRRLIGEDIELAWLPGKESAPVKIDPSQIDQILVNLCVNARDAITGVGKVTIETDNIAFDEDYCTQHAGCAPGDYVLLAISDDGCGMDQETIGHLFEPFFTSKEMGKGTGLGLATVYGAVTQNNGFINVYSEPGRGTAFKIYLPRNAAKVAPKPEQAPAPAAGGGETILLVEDDPMILRIATRMLEGLGYAILAVHTPGEAMRLARERAGRIDLLMTDVVMPEMNGRDLARNLLRLSPHIKCLFMSGYTANVIAHQGVLDEGVHFIQKPFSMKELAAKVRDVLANG